MSWLKAVLILSFALATTSARAQAGACVDLFQNQRPAPGQNKSQIQRKKPMSSLKVAAVQFPLDEGATPQAFLHKVADYIKTAKNHGSDLIVFPELVTTELVDWYSKDASEIQQLTGIARDFAPQYIDFIKQQAKANQISILGGTTPRETANGIVNTAILAFPDGRVVLQDKLFLTPDEKQWAWVGGETLQVFEAPWGKTVITICFDTEFPAISALIANEKPDVILVPSWTSTHSGLNRVDYTARARAVEHFAYVIKTGTVAGPNATLPHFGQASLHTPQDVGFPVKPQEGKLNEASILYGTLDLQLLRTGKAKSGFYPSNEQSLREQPIKLERK